MAGWVASYTQISSTRCIENFILVKGVIEKFFNYSQNNKNDKILKSEENFKNFDAIYI